MFPIGYITFGRNPRWRRNHCKKQDYYWCLNQLHCMMLASSNYYSYKTKGKFKAKTKAEELFTSWVNSLSRAWHEIHGKGLLERLPTGPEAELEKLHKDPGRETADPVLFASPAGTSRHEFCIAVTSIAIAKILAIINTLTQLNATIYRATDM